MALYSLSLDLFNGIGDCLLEQNMEMVYGDENAEIWLLDICFFIVGEFLK